jgi:hypothetical protein
MGLKAYDLVWLEGKSAAWRYPSEIEELSSFAPVVEEQPFDRFYKKASPATSAPSSTTQIPVAVAVESQLQRSSPLSAGKRIIYVTMPAGKSPAREIPLQSAVRELTPTYARAAIEDYSAQPVAEQPTLVDNLPHWRSPKTALKTKAAPKTRAFARFVAIGLCILALLAAGIFIGLSLNKDTLGLQHKMEANTTPASSTSGATSDVSPATLPIAHPTAQQLPASAVTSPSVSARREDPIVNTSTVPAKPIKKSQKSQKINETAAADRSAHGAVKYTTAPAPKDSATTAIPTMQREAVHRSDNAETNHTTPAVADKEALRTALASQISVGANTYSVGTFGGISDLQVTVTNRSAYPLDLVVVEVQYVQANKKVFKTENLYFRGIGAGSALMLEAPKTSRGIKVQYKVMTINSRELGIPGA